MYVCTNRVNIKKESAHVEDTYITDILQQGQNELKFG